MTWWQSTLLGVVQGFTEFIPVSSTAHLRIVPSLLGWDDPGAAFSAVIQLGTLAAVLAYFAQDIGRLTVAAIAWPLSRGASHSEDGRLAWSIAAGNLPIVVLGILGKDFIETGARSLYLIAAMLILVALALAWVERRPATNRGDESSRAAADNVGAQSRLGGMPLQLAAKVEPKRGIAARMGTLTLRTVFIIGCFQALALIPGASRSGVTILGGLWLGLARAEAARFSFLLGVPAILGAGLFELRTLSAELAAGTGADAMGLGLGLLTAAVSGYASIGFLLRYLKTRTTMAFVVYRIALGLLILGLASFGLIR
jgi:undecaprenyl-diphosphatase